MNTNLNISNSEYDDLISQKAQKSPILRNVIAAFIVGGLICVLGQFINNKMLNLGIDKETASTITSISLIFLAALLTSLNLFSRIGRFAGTGATVPITGFSNSIVAPAIEYKSEGYILGLGANMFKVAGPVLVYGISTSVILGFVYYLLNYVF
ncbi:MAG: stage V sporulation protein AC [Clostridia bacterium]|nr:stage V sporulation protein AC [Clostridia bacterium]